MERRDTAQVDSNRLGVDERVSAWRYQCLEGMCGCAEVPYMKRYLNKHLDTDAEIVERAA